MRIGIVVCSDRVSSGKQTDKVVDALTQTLKDSNSSEIRHAIVPDDIEIITKQLLDFCDQCDVVLTSGGTGLGPRDVTPEATTQIAEREIPGLSEHMRSSSTADTAMLSCGIVVQRGQTLIINLPGSPKGAAESLILIVDVLPHAIDVMKGAHH